MTLIGLRDQHSLIAREPSIHTDLKKAFNLFVNSTDRLSLSMLIP